MCLTWGHISLLDYPGIPLRSGSPPTEYTSPFEATVPPPKPLGVEDVTAGCQRGCVPHTGVAVAETKDEGN